MVKPDTWIRKMALEHGMIEPFAESVSEPGVISYGLSAYGYDMRISNKFKIFSGSFHRTPNLIGGVKTKNGLIDPKSQATDMYRDVTCDVLELPTHSSTLGRSVEYFRIPRDVITVTFGKSTYARCGVLVNITPFEPEWEGYVTISIFNMNNHPVQIYTGEGIAQVLFLGSDGVCEKSYADKKGKYQSQKDITISKVTRCAATQRNGNQ